VPVNFTFGNWSIYRFWNRLRPVGIEDPTSMLGRLSLMTFSPLQITWTHPAHGSVPYQLVRSPLELIILFLKFIRTSARAALLTVTIGVRVEEGVALLLQTSSWGLQSVDVILKLSII